MNTKERKEFLSNGKKLFVVFPTIEENRLADIEYSKTYNQCIKEGLPFVSELEKTLKDRGIFGQEQEQKFREIQSKLEDLIPRLQTERDAERRSRLSAEYKAVKLELYHLNTERSRHLIHSVETKCDEAKIAFLVCRSTQNEDGSLYWKTMEEFKNETDQSLVQSAAYNFLSLVNNLSDNFFDEVPELIAIEEAVEKPAEEAKETGAIA